MIQNTSEHSTSRTTRAPSDSLYDTLRTITLWPTDTALYYFDVKLTAKFREWEVIINEF